MPKDVSKGIPKDVPKGMSKDVSKKTIAILLVVAIILSVTSTLLAVAREPIIKEADNPTADAQITVQVVEPPEPVEAQVEVQVVEKE